jgi:hypothetical protein
MSGHPNDRVLYPEPEESQAPSPSKRGLAPLLRLTRIVLRGDQGVELLAEAGEDLIV